MSHIKIMSDIAIRVENLSKRYRIGRAQQRHDTLRDSLAASLRNLGQWGSRNGQTPSDDFWALKDVSFEVKQGEVVGIIGRNGAGKSTLLKILSQITEPTSGRVELHGRVASLLEVGTGFHPELSGRENIYLSGTILGMKKAEIDRKFDEIVDFSGVEKFIDTPVKRYSSGMNVRLGFAVAAHLNSEILLVDEVVAVGDASFQAKCFQKLRLLSNEQRTILLVSHNLLQVRQLSDRSLLFNDGQKLLDDYTEDVVKTYLEGLNDFDDFDENTPVVICDLYKQQTSDLFTITALDVLYEGKIETGSPIKIIIKFMLKERMPLLAIGLRCYDETGIEIFRLGTYPFSNYDCLRDVKNGNVSCNIPKMPLVGGKYSFKLVVWIPNGEILAELDQAIIIQVHSINYYGGIVSLDQSCGVTVIDNLEWSYFETSN